MTRLRGTDTRHVGAAERLMDELRDAIQDAESARTCRKMFDALVEVDRLSTLVDANIDSIEHARGAQLALSAELENRLNEMEHGPVRRYGRRCIREPK